MCKRWAIKTGPCTATFNDLLGYEIELKNFVGLWEEAVMAY
jgi:hypothetical protein